MESPLIRKPGNVLGAVNDCLQNTLPPPEEYENKRREIDCKEKECKELVNKKFKLLLGLWLVKNIICPSLSSSKNQLLFKNEEIVENYPENLSEDEIEQQDPESASNEDSIIWTPAKLDENKQEKLQISLLLFFVFFIFGLIWLAKMTVNLNSIH
ncbi:unnamed protein product [Blepharisma stoltei]|uniref:Uncharacterized protein n=1 Tax=Blepharisma stoltei TaxID=1481888 RepID=A0AAU9JT63_9CILI|nr:unnamed protein product [Blepharisma stoltei]